ncbi:hypothetical protein [Lysinibacillus sp. SGAir0095]|uniref:hypothetical protein n=1 Tax=Lysinibacillus sp. SGAir0095 TaxID=2070463 RepID=UPI0010CD1714|nr:hypothetical protein [Lysinibacillus sp. SGAir0095]QCR30962.1 hypothetical protein C1N55_01740 [Lysinibacillus sp. SGAir0095]
MIKWIIAAEILFWIAIFAGLFTRYVLHQKRLSLLLFLLTPLIDLALIALTVVDLQSGSAATIAHGISVIYIGVSIAYGKTMIAWADNIFQTYFLKKEPAKKKLYGVEKGLYELKMWGRHVFAYAIGSVLFWLIITFVNSNSTEALFNVWRIWSIALLIDGGISLSYLVFPKRAASK